MTIAIAKFDRQLDKALHQIEANQAKAAIARKKAQARRTRILADSLEAKLIEIGDYLREQGMLN